MPRLRRYYCFYCRQFFEAANKTEADVHVEQCLIAYRLTHPKPAEPTQPPTDD